MMGNISFDDIPTKYENTEFKFFMILDFETFSDSKSMGFEVERP